MKRKMMLVILATLMLWAISARAQVIWHGPGDVTVSSCMLQDEDWLFLPSGTKLAQLELTASGERILIDWTQHSHESDVIPGVLSGVLPQTGKTLHVFVSQNLRSLHLFSDDPVQHGRLWLENCRLHENETTGSIIMLRSDGSISVQMQLDQLRGRGNSTWRNVEYKSPYQFKLEYKADLLETGIEAERCRTWTLLTNERDPTLLRNQIALDLAKELKLSSASACEQVDLYYDGDYRGVYLLAEKVEVNEHSVNIRDFDKLLKPVNKKLGVSDPSDLPSPTNYTSEDPQADAYNSYGYDYGYADGVYDNRDVHAGGYLLELESRGTLTDHAWFRLSADRFIALKTPEYAGPTMVKSISELFLYAYEAMLNYGYHPVTGQPIEELIDIDSFTRSHLVAELFYNATLYSWSSTFFVIPEGESRIYAGPVWDFDMGIGNVTHKGNEALRNYDSLWVRQINPWFNYLLEFEDFRNLVGTVLVENKELIETTLANEYMYAYSKAVAMEKNFVTWQILGKPVWTNPSYFNEYLTWGQHVEYTREYLKNGLEFLIETYSK